MKSLEALRETLRTRRNTRVCRRQMRENQDGSGTWLYLNKQAALSGILAICTEPAESPMGPIKLVLESSDMDGVIDWLAPYSG